jgi:hypothetical protein
MYKLLIIAFAIMFAFAVGAQASALNPPPAQGGYLAGWGMNPNNWDATSGSYTAWGIYNPLYVGGGAAWVVGYGVGNVPIYITYAPITLQLWIEMYCLQTYHYTSYQWHRLGNLQENICFIVEGTIQSNNGQFISLTRGTEDLDKLYFRENIFGGASPGPPAPNLALLWQGTWGNGLVYGVTPVWGPNPITPNPNVTMLIDVPCDHWFQFQGCFTIPYHQPDGYYSLTMAGCPAPLL